MIIGLDIGGTKTAAVLGDDQGKIHERVQFPTRGFDATMKELYRRIEGFKDRAQCISVSIGGPLDIGKGIIHSPPNLPGWDDIPLKDLLEQRFGLPVFVEHDGNAGALAEWYFGAGKGARNVLFFTMGTGFGGGLILDGRLYRGATSQAGEAGHIRLAETGPLAYGKEGSWEAFCSGAGIRRLAALRFPDKFSDIEPAALAGLDDPDARAIFNEVGFHLGRGLSMLIDLLNPEVIVLGSLAVRLGNLILDPAIKVIEEEALPRSRAACRIVPAALGEQLGDIASLCAAIGHCSTRDS
jgi:glucokinase